MAFKITGVLSWSLSSEYRKNNHRVETEVFLHGTLNRTTIIHYYGELLLDKLVFLVH